jgi:uncharacterized membrane protein YkvA (DUF1232 family)
LLSLIGGYWKGRYRDESLKSNLIFTAAIIYIVIPIDIIPDYKLRLGQIDDDAILALSPNFLERDFSKYNLWKPRNSDGL